MLSGEMVAGAVASLERCCWGRAFLLGVLRDFWVSRRRPPDFNTQNVGQNGHQNVHQSFPNATAHFAVTYHFLTVQGLERHTPLPEARRVSKTFCVRVSTATLFFLHLTISLVTSFQDIFSLHPRFGSTCKLAS